MSENLSIEAPEFDRIKKESGQSTRDGIQLLWQVANAEAKDRRRGVRLAQERSQRKVQIAAPTTQQDNYDWDGSGIIAFTGSTSFNLTGLRNGVQGDKVELHNLGTGSVTLRHESASSEATNRLDTYGDASVIIATGCTTTLRYLNSRWRQEVPAVAFNTSFLPWGPIFALTPPDDSQFSWVNQGTATITANGSALYLNTGTPATGDNLRVRTKTAPATPYTVTAGVILLMPQVDFMFAGIGFRESSSGKITTLTVGSSSVYSTSGIHVSAQKWTNPTTFSASYTLTGSLYKADSFDGSLLWLRIADDGVNRKLSFSRDGQNFVQVHSVSRTDFLTADQVCFWANANNASYGIGLTLLSWLEG